MPHHGTKSTSFFIQFGGRYLHSRQLDFFWLSSQAPGHMHGALSCLHVIFIVKRITCPIFHRHVDAYAIDRKCFLGFIRGINNTRSTFNSMQLSSTTKCQSWLFTWFPDSRPLGWKRMGRHLLSSFIKLEFWKCDISAVRPWILA